MQSSTYLQPHFPRLQTDHPVVFGWLADRNLAELALSDLIGIGISEQDLTLVEPNGDGGTAASLDFAFSPISGTRLEDAGDLESEIGGGIATDDSDDDASGAQDMDDSESASEDYLYPSSGRSYSDEASLGLDQLVDRGFSEGPGGIPGARRIPEAFLTSIHLPDMGLIAGEGSFGTQLIEARYRGGAEAVRRWLWGNSEPDGKEPCVLAIDATTEGPAVDAIETILNARGASRIEHLGV